jgi:hypothetical protein
MDPVRLIAAGKIPHNAPLIFSGVASFAGLATLNLKGAGKVCKAE